MSGFLFVHFNLALGALDDAHLDQFRKPRAISRYSTLLDGKYPGLRPLNAFDRNSKTCFREPLTTGLSQDLSTAMPQPAPEYRNPTISGELGLSHRAGHPPVIRNFDTLSIQFCRTELSVLPRQVEVQFFRQKLYDVDRQYRIPDAPEHWKSMRFPVRSLQEKYNLSLERFKESSGFPDEFYNVWVRLIFLMPGEAEPNQEICLVDVSSGPAFFPVSEENDSTCP